jgi:hypothetical protein
MSTPKIEPPPNALRKIAKRFPQETDAQLAKHAEIARRYSKPFHFAEKRIEEVEDIALHRYGDILPEDEMGRRFVFVLANHMGEAKRILIMLANRAPWYPEDDADELIARVERRRTRWKPDTLAKFLNVTYAEHKDHKLRTIGALDMPKAERKALRRARYRERERGLDRLRKTKRRRANGAKPHAESASRTKPWEAAGYSCRRTWERRGKPPPEAVSQISPEHTSFLRKASQTNLRQTPRKPRRRKSLERQGVSRGSASPKANGSRRAGSALAGGDHDLRSRRTRGMKKVEAKNDAIA